MSGTPPVRPSQWRRFTALYARLLDHLLVVSIGVLIVPVTLQVFSRYLPFVPTFEWTEEMARFLFVWSIMIGATIGVRESTHFEVDLWSGMSRRAEAAFKLVTRLGVLVLSIAFLWAGIEFTRFAWHRISELAELPLWLIHIAWPVASFTWLVFLGEQFADDLRTLLGRNDR
ncbi:MAG: TRAP transporter small permease [Hyphomicrobiaceae bacterium]|nr:MAG: TRAP transporter small permease [Hyphomicrobiaceae bacterium]